MWADVPQAVQAARTPHLGSSHACITHVLSMRTRRVIKPCRKIPRKPSQQNQGP